MQTFNFKTSRGLTLIELMVTVAIIAIIAAVAVPAYEKQAQKSRRADGIALLMDAAAREERFVIDNNVYTTTMTGSTGLGLASADSQKGYYALSAVLGADSLSYTLTATAQNGQENDVCGNLTLTSKGVRSSSASSNCW